MMRTLAFCLWAWALPGPAHAGVPSTASLKGIDVYRSETVSPESAQRLLQAKVAQYVARLNEGGRAAQHSADLIKAELVERMSRLGDFAYVGLNAGRSITASSNEITVTFDVVDAKDAAQRMPFRKPPTSHLRDPAGLLAQWHRYSELCAALRKQGEPVMDRPACPAFYCPWVQRTEQVQQFEELFAREVPDHLLPLALVLSKQAEPGDRAAAAYLLAFSTSGPVLAQQLTEAVSDPDSEVRAAALSVLADMAAYHQEVFIDSRRILPALDFPTTTDRSKALAVLAGLAPNAQYRTYLSTRAGPRLVRLLRSLDPDVHDLAFAVLGMVSGRSYSADDLESWEQWAKQQAAAAGPSDGAR